MASGIIDDAVAGESFTGTKSSDTLNYDVTGLYGSTPDTNYETLNGGAGNDSLYLTLTVSQLAALKAEINETSTAWLKDDSGLWTGSDPTGQTLRIVGDALSVFTGNQYTTIQCLGIQTKMWEKIYVTVVADPSTPPNFPDGNFSSAGSSIDLNLINDTLNLDGTRTEVKPEEVAAYFDGGPNVPATTNFSLSSYVGSQFSDRMIGDGTANTFDGSAGNDYIDSGAGEDTINGGADSDEIHGGDGADTLNGGIPNNLDAIDHIYGEGGNDTITVYSGYADGGGGDDRIIGAASPDPDLDFSGASYASATTGILANLTGSINFGLAAGNNLTGFLVSDGLGGIDLVSGLHFFGDSAFDDEIKVDATYQSGNGSWLEVRLSAGDDQVEFGPGMATARISFFNAGGAVSADMEAGTATDLNVGDNFIGQDTFSGANEFRGSIFNDHVLGKLGDDQLLRGAAGDDTIDGRSGDDLLWGERGDDTLIGGDGNDELVGGVGNDIFLFNAPLATAGNDIIDDFTVGDKIHLDNAVFTNLADGALSTDNFFEVGSGVQDADDFIVYDPSNGDLIYDSNGSAAAGQTQFATLANLAALSAGDFSVI